MSKINITHKSEIHNALHKIDEQIAEAIRRMGDSAFSHSSGDEWSAENYVKHLLLANKPLAKALNLPLHKFVELFDHSDRDSYSYDEVTSAYNKRLDEGIRAEQLGRMVPDTYRNKTDEPVTRESLLVDWETLTQNYNVALLAWDDPDLDAYLMPHPVLGKITVREMLFFTIHHNTLHYHDMVRVGGL